MKKCHYCSDSFANNLNRKIHETTMHKESKPRDSKYHKPLVFSTTPHIGSVETVIEGDGTICINPTKKYPKGKVYVWSHVHGYCTRDPCIFCGRGDLTDIKKEWGIKDD